MKKIAEALAAAIAAAPEAERNRLAQAIEDYAAESFWTWRKIRGRKDGLALLLDSLIEETDARVEG